jgi:hypothetical protein
MGLQRVLDIAGVLYSEPAELTDSEQRFVTEIEYQESESAEFTR